MSDLESPRGYMIRQASDNDWSWVIWTVHSAIRSTLGTASKSISDSFLALRAEALCEAARQSQKDRDEMLVVVADDGSRAALLWIGETVDDYTAEPRAFILNLFVTPDHRHRGIGTWLMSVAHDWAKDRGYGAISLSVGANNQSAVRLYEECGFIAENIRMTRRITDGDE